MFSLFLEQYLDNKIEYFCFNIFFVLFFRKKRNLLFKVNKVSKELSGKNVSIYFSPKELNPFLVSSPWSFLFVLESPVKWNSFTFKYFYFTWGCCYFLQWYELNVCLLSLNTLETEGDMWDSKKWLCCKVIEIKWIPVHCDSIKGWLSLS